jgi:hypothetical protein
MALTDLERKRCERDLAKFMERRRPPPDIRSTLDIGYYLMYNFFSRVMNRRTESSS